MAKNDKWGDKQDTKLKHIFDNKLHSFDTSDPRAETAQYIRPLIQAAFPERAKPDKIGATIGLIRSKVRIYKINKTVTAGRRAGRSKYNALFRWLTTCACDCSHSFFLYCDMFYRDRNS
jgi:hypothetical protein